MTKVISKSFRDEEKFNKLVELYEKDKKAAKIYFRLQDSRIFSYDERRVTEKDGHFYLYDETRTLNISKNGRRYLSKSTNIFYIFKEGKNFYKSGPKLMPITLSMCYELLAGKHRWGVTEQLITKYPWLRNFAESKNENLQNTTLNYIQRHKCFNVRDLAAKRYGTPRPVAIELMKFYQFDKRFWDKYRDHVICHQVNPELHEKTARSLVQDTIQMAYKLDEKVNLAWSPNRMTQEHDDFSRRLLTMQMQLDNRELKVKDIYKKFAQFVGSDYELITNSARLVHEGATMKHCVGGYDASVDSGRCAILRVGHHTLEIATKSQSNGFIAMKQFKGFRNAEPPKDLILRVTVDVEEFNKSLGTDEPQPVNRVKYTAPDEFANINPEDLLLEDLNIRF